jgi:phospholipid/cholesterol/gamma-HCH transport system substrate-binding protein
MAKRSDEVKVGILVIATGTILILTISMIVHYNPFRPARKSYRTYFKFAGGLESDSIVRFGGIKVGKVASVHIAPNDPSLIEVEVRLREGVPLKTDSIARLASLNALGENYIEISPGNKNSPWLKPGDTIRSEETPEFSALLTKFNGLSDDAQKLINDLDKNVNQISKRADLLLSNLNEVTNEKNRKNFSETLEQTNSLIAQNSPRINAITSNLQATTKKLDPLMEDIRKATSKLDALVGHLDSTVIEDRPQIKKDLAELETTLLRARSLMEEIDSTLVSNRSDIDAMIENFRRSSENLSEFTGTIKQRPFSLIRVKPMPDRKVPK